MRPFPPKPPTLPGPYALVLPNAGSGGVEQFAYWGIARPEGGGDAIGEAELHRELPAGGDRAVPSVGDATAARRVERDLLGQRVAGGRSSGAEG